MASPFLSVISSAPRTRVFASDRLLRLFLFALSTLPRHPLGRIKEPVALELAPYPDKCLVHAFLLWVLCREERRFRLHSLLREASVRTEARITATASIHSMRLQADLVRDTIAAREVLSPCNIFKVASRWPCSYSTMSALASDHIQQMSPFSAGIFHLLSVPAFPAARMFNECAERLRSDFDLCHSSESA